MPVRILLCCLFAAAILSSCIRRQTVCAHQNFSIKDSVIYKIDTVYIYKYIDTVYSRSGPDRSISADDASSESPAVSIKDGKLDFNTSNFGVGPSLGAYYSPFNGFDLIVGFSVQYYFLSLPLKFRRGHKAMYHSHSGHHPGKIK